MCYLIRQLENITKKPPSKANEETMSMISEETGNNH